MMHMQHVASHQLSRLRRRYPFLRSVTATTSILLLVWIYTLYWGERSVFNGHVRACDWKTWEDWPREASPHHLVFIADPQLVDPHTYPGRPWPLSTLTEMYTDAYMARNFRLINQVLDPDSIVFLGDLFDGGREWAPAQAKPLKSSQRKHLDNIGVSPEAGKRSLETYKAAMAKSHAHAISKADHNIGKNGEDLRAFRPGENGRWSRWGQEQWDADFERFSRIFLDPDQLYPNGQRTFFPAYGLSDRVGLENGADNAEYVEYATSGGKQRQVITTLPGNHDLGFGAMVQLAIRDRFESHFGEGNRIDVLGNHTFISIDSPSLSAQSQYLKNGYESGNDQARDAEYIWDAPMEFIRDLRIRSRRIVSEALDQLYPKESKHRGWQHDVANPMGDSQIVSRDKEQATTSSPQFPVVLLTHVPLYRQPETECGKQRENGRAIRVAMGYQYQNVITQTLSREIVTKVSAAGDIALAFSGDDHDYCDVNHRYNLPAYSPDGSEDKLKVTLKNLREITVKSFSWAMGVRKPGFQLVSLWNPIDAEGNSIKGSRPTVQSHMCLLPDQLSTFIDYAFLLLYTIPALMVRAIVLAIRSKEPAESDSELSTPLNMSLPRFKPKANGTANGYARATEKFTERSGRHRASSTSTSTNANSNNTLQVQRSFNARTRSISPAIGLAGNTPLIEKAGYFPPVKWHDPTDDDSDEESHVGAPTVSEYEDDSQAKWKWRRRTLGNVRVAMGEFGTSLLVVGLPSVLFYAVLIRNG